MVNFQGKIPLYTFWDCLQPQGWNAKGECVGIWFYKGGWKYRLIGAPEVNGSWWSEESLVKVEGDR